MTKYAVALGSNLGDRVGHLRAAIAAIGELGEVEAVSGLYETAPVGGPEQGPYLNSVAILHSDLSPQELLGRLQSVESEREREREVRWGPRTLDLDIVAMEPGSVDMVDLQVPHRRAPERRFVVEPLAEVWPEAPVADGVTARGALPALESQDVDLLLESWVEPGGEPGRYWVGAQFLLFLVIGLALVLDGSLPGPSWAPWGLVGVILLGLGAIVALLAARSLGPAFTPMPEPVQGSDLVETGLYGLVRHPIYGALCLITSGAALLFASPWALAFSAVLAVLLWAKSGYEERRLRVAHPGYTAYRARVRHRMLPFLF